MPDKALTLIPYIRALSDQIATAGQPSPRQLETVAQAGYELVVNLALEDGHYALDDEAGMVRELGMDYINIPVVWQTPTLVDLERFFQVMADNEGRRLFIHCAANKRVSVFMYLYRRIRCGWPYEQAWPDVTAIWQPDETWQFFINKALTHYHPRPA